MITVFPSPLGFITLEEEENALIRLSISREGRALAAPSPLLAEAQRQLTAYFQQRLQQFSLPLAPKGTPFQQRVWQGLLSIPYGCTLSYAQLAAHIGKAKACRAVGQANGKNPLPILIPCHRVIAANGGLGGYSAGYGMKEQLLALEKIQPWASEIYT